MKTTHRFSLMLLLLIVMGGGKLIAQSTDPNHKIWAIFDGRAKESVDGKLPSGQTTDTYNSVEQITWNGVRACDDLDLNSNTWRRRGQHYMPESGLNGEITVNGKKMFPGISFTASANNDVEQGKLSEDLASFELATREYYIFMNNNNGNKTSSFTLNIPNGSLGYYLWIEAVTNVTDPSTSKSDEGLNFSVVKGNTDIQSTNRYDRWNARAEHDPTNKNPKEYEKHLFCYYIWNGQGGAYTITPSRGCYIYYVAILNHAPLVVDFATHKRTMSVGSTATYLPDIYYSEYTAYPKSKQSEDLLDEDAVIFSSDDETVATVDQNGKVTAVGKGVATITATVKQGTPMGGINYPGAYRTFTLEHACSDSYTVTVNDNNVIETTKNVENETPTPWQKYTFSKGGTEYLNLYLGGWKYQSNTALAGVYSPKNGLPDNYKGGDGKDKTDKWDAVKTYQVGKKTPKDYQSVAIDGYNLHSTGNQNGKSEFLYSGILLPGDYVLEFDERHPEVTNWENVREEFKDYTGGKGNPFTVPCFGSFIKIEPEYNGTLTLYLIQNGTIDYYSGTSDDDPDGNAVLNTIGWRPVYIVDEAGNRLSSNEVKAITKQRTLVSREDETINVYERSNNSVSLVKEGNRGITYWEAVQKYEDSNTGNIYQLHKHVFDKYWNRRGEAEQVLGPDITGDGWLVISKAYVKYQFDVKAGKSYYVFSNKSAVGYCGATFLPTESPSGDYTFNEDGTIKTNNSNKTYSNINDLLGNNESITVNSITVKNANGFHEGWNSICLPFSITESKMRGIFGAKTTKVKTGQQWVQDNWLSGHWEDVYSDVTTTNEDYEVVIFNGCTEETDKDGNKTDKVHFFHHVYQDIIAGYPYMIYIPKGADIAKTNKFEVEKVTIERANLENLPTISTSRQYMPAESGFEDHAEIDDFTFTGIYEPTLIPRGSYCVVSGGIQIYDAVTLPGYRAYLDPSYKKNGTSNYDIKRITATNLNEMSYIWDEVNPIKSVFADEMPDNGFTAPSDVYTASGVLVRKNSTSLDGLPSGIYIVNGKKYFVK